MIERLHFHRGYSLRLHKSKPFINYGIISTTPRLGHPGAEVGAPAPDGRIHLVNQGYGGEANVLTPETAERAVEYVVPTARSAGGALDPIG